MRVLIYGDIYGRVWRKAFEKEYAAMCKKYAPDFTIANIENITSGRWPVSEHAEFINDLWVDLMTGGDHIFDNVPNINTYLEKDDSNLIRPANFYMTQEYPLAGNGYKIIEKNGKRLLLIQLLWEVFMNHKVENPFSYIESLLQTIPEESYDACIVEFHRETTAELYGMARLLEGKSALVYGTHTHIQTNDAHILPWGTWVQADVGMNGPFYSVIGAEFDSVKKRFLSGISRGKIEQALKGPYVINALIVDIDPSSGLCTHIENISFTWEL